MTNINKLLVYVCHQNLDSFCLYHHVNSWCWFWVFFQVIETIFNQSACVFSLGNYLNDYRTCVILQISRFTTRYPCIHTEPSLPINANTFLLWGGGGGHVLLFSETAHCNTWKIYQNKAGDESLNKPLIEQTHQQYFLFSKSFINSFLDYMSTAAVTFNHQLTLTNKLHFSGLN